MNSGPRDQFDCAIVNGLLAAFVRGGLGPEQRGRVDGHLETCDACADALGQQIAEAMAAGEISQSAKVRREVSTLPKMMSRPVLSWHRHRVSAPVLRKKGYYSAVHSASLRRGVAMSGSAEDMVEIQLLDAGMDIVAGKTIRANIIEAPYFTRDGDFKMSLWLDEKDVEQYRGYSAICVLKLENIWLAFESPVASQELPFRARELPPLEAETLLRSDAFGYFLSAVPLVTSAA